MLNYRITSTWVSINFLHRRARGERQALPPEALRYHLGFRCTPASACSQHTTSANNLQKKVSSKHLMLGVVMLTGLAFMLYSRQTWYPLALIAYLPAYLPQAGIMVGYNPLLLSVTPNSVMGRVQAVLETVLFATSLLSASLAGVLGQVVPVSTIFLGSGLLIVLSGVLGLFVLPAQAQQQA